MNSEYALLDSGHRQKLEQLGPWRLIRPAPMALWPPFLSKIEWNSAHGVFRSKGDRGGGKGGGWIEPTEFPESWLMNHAGFPFLVKPNKSGGIGFFPEHSELWRLLARAIGKSCRTHNPKVLNAFASTGGATMAASGAGAEVCHLDGSGSSVSRARENMKLAGLENRPVRWIVDDAVKFCAREKRRGVRYDAVVLDPPSFGRGSRGETWKIERDLAGFIELVSSILSEAAFLVLLSCHSPGFTPLILESLLHELAETRGGRIVSGELRLPDGGSKRKPLPAGAFAAWTGRIPETPRGNS